MARFDVVGIGGCRVHWAAALQTPAPDTLVPVGRRAETIRSTTRMAVLAKYCRKSRAMVPAAGGFRQVHDEVKDRAIGPPGAVLHPDLMRPSHLISSHLIQGLRVQCLQRFVNFICSVSVSRPEYFVMDPVLNKYLSSSPLEDLCLRKWGRPFAPAIYNYTWFPSRGRRATAAKESRGKKQIKKQENSPEKGKEGHTKRKRCHQIKNTRSCENEGGGYAKETNKLGSDEGLSGRNSGFVPRVALNLFGEYDGPPPPFC